MGFIVCEVISDDVTSALIFAEYVEVVVFVDVFDIVLVAVGAMPKLRPILNSSRPGGIVATRPIDNNIISHFIPIYYI